MALCIPSIRVMGVFPLVIRQILDQEALGAKLCVHRGICIRSSAA